jgi:transposase InsO family protein
LQQQVVAEVELARTRSEYPVRASLKAFGVAPATYYRWKRDASWEREKRKRTPPVQAYEALPEERQRVVEYAKEHPEVRHRELSWRMVDEDVAYVSATTVYRILRDAQLMCRRPGRTKRYREQEEKAQAPDHIWATDLMYVTLGGQRYYLVNFIDEYSRYVVHSELMSSMDGHSMSQAAQRALETLPMDEEGKVASQPIIRSDNGSGYISSEFKGLLSHHGLTHQRIRPSCPEENGIVERFHRTVREGMDELELESRHAAERQIQALIEHYNTTRLHSSLDFQTPATWYRGNPRVVTLTRRRKLAQARHRRRQINLGIRQRTLPFNFESALT